jgi:hypothetical protein
MLTSISFPETTKKTIEETAAVFGDDVAVRIDDADKEVDMGAVQQHDTKENAATVHNIEQL